MCDNTNIDGEPQEKRPKLDENVPFSEAFSNLKKSEFFQEELPASSQEETSNPKNTPKLNTLLINPKQRGNPIIKFITSVPYQYTDIIPDYVVSKTGCILFLSLRYHQLKPDYIHERLKSLGSAYSLRVLLVQVDVADPHHSLKHLTRICILADLTLMLAWSAEEAGKIIETYKIFEFKPPDMIMEQSETAPYLRLASAFTTVRSVNKNDATTLLTTFGKLEDVIKAPVSTLSLCPGFGMQKAQRLHKVLHEPFLREKK